MAYSRLPLARSRRVRIGAAVGLVCLIPGCVSAQTGHALDAAYDAAGARLRARSAAPIASDTGLGTELERDELIAVAVARSPNLTRLAHRIRALVHGARAEGSVPAPELMLQAWNLPLTRPYAPGEADMYMLELRQRFPPAGLLDARARQLAEEAQAMLAELSGEERRVAGGAADLYVDYVQVVAERRILEQRGSLLDRMSAAARARYTTGTSGLAEVARIDLELAQTERALARNKASVARTQTAINVLLGQPVGTAIGEPTMKDPEIVRASLQELFAQAESMRGSSLEAAARLRAATARREAAEAEAKYPEVTLGLGYWQAPEMRPGVGFSASMSLPWLWGPDRRRLEQAREEEAAERAAREAATLEAETEIADAHSRMLALEEQWRMVSRRSLPAARRSLEALTTGLSTGNASSLDWLEAARTVADLEMDAVSSCADLARSVSALERAVGSPLPHSALQLEPRP